jgi:hypothetical protein
LGSDIVRKNKNRQSTGILESSANLEQIYPCCVSNERNFTTGWTGKGFLVGNKRLKSEYRYPWKKAIRGHRTDVYFCTAGDFGNLGAAKYRKVFAV